jgi:hypothetical protein
LRDPCGDRESGAKKLLLKLGDHYAEAQWCWRGDNGRKMGWCFSDCGRKYMHTLIVQGLPESCPVSREAMLSSGAEQSRLRWHQWCWEKRKHPEETSKDSLLENMSTSPWCQSNLNTHK